jgi:putative tricarboxylic transport membrane protein
MQEPASPNRLQTLLGAGAVLLALALAAGASIIPSAAGYAGVGPNFLPWAVSLVLLVCGVWLVWEAWHGGFRQMEPPSGAASGDWRALAWVSAGVLANAALISHIGFVLSCALCFALAVRGLRLSEGRAGGGLRQCVVDAVGGLLLAAPVYWMFTKLLGINLPALTGSGWL